MDRIRLCKQNLDLSPFFLKSGLILLLSFHLFLARSEAQISKGFVLKTIVLQDVFYQNPNLIIEKRISPKFSVEIQGAVRNGALASYSTEGAPIPSLHDCEGFTAGVSVRYFFVKGRTSPNSWYVSGVLRYNEILMKNENMGDKYYDKADIRRSGAEMGVLIGRQFLVAKFMTTEFYLGAGGFRKSQKEVFVSGEVPWPDREFVDVIFRPYLGWTFGFFFPW